MMLQDRNEADWQARSLTQPPYAESNHRLSNVRSFVYEWLLVSSHSNHTKYCVASESLFWNRQLRPVFIAAPPPTFDQTYQAGTLRGLP
jgi:hypothetical protein